MLARLRRRDCRDWRRGSAAGVGQLGHPGLERDAAEQRRADLFGQPLAAARGEQLEPAAGLGIDERAHVLDHADHRHPTRSNISAPRSASPTAISCGVVTMTAPGDLGGLHQGELRVAGAGRKIDDEVVELAPVHILQELGTNFMMIGPRQMAGASRSTRKPSDMSGRRGPRAAGSSADHRRLLEHAEHPRDVGPVDVGVHHAHRRRPAPAPPPGSRRRWTCPPRPCPRRSR